MEHFHEDYKKLCKDCKWSKAIRLFGLFSPIYKCKNPKNKVEIDLVTGNTTTMNDLCLYQRMERSEYILHPNLCGKDGEWWELRKVKE